MPRVGLSSKAWEGRLFYLVCVRGRSQKDKKIQSEKVAGTLQPKADAKFLQTLEPNLNKCRATLTPSGRKYLGKVLIQLQSMPTSLLSLKWMGEGSAPDHHVSRRIWPLICIHGTVPGIEGADKIYTSHCLPFAYFFLNHHSFSLTVLILTIFLIFCTS